LKRIFDVVVALGLLLASVPLLILTVIAVRLTSKGPAIFGHERCGRDGTSFRCLKLRTMVVDAEDWLERDEGLKALHRANDFKLPSTRDPRVTSIGRFLRFTHFDELPQLLNVLRGDMSLVGPRPVVEEELGWYGDRARDLLSVRPGIFGEWTAMGRSRSEYPNRVTDELAYVQNMSFGADLWILVRHVPVVLVGQVED
jgi:exopolysaccharide production protein ExoY